MRSIARVAALLFVAGLLAGCPSLGSRNALVGRVIEAGAEGDVAQAGGCSAQVTESDASAAGKGSVKFVLIYKGARCSGAVWTK